MIDDKMLAVLGAASKNMTDTEFFAELGPDLKGTVVRALERRYLEFDKEDFRHLIDDTGRPVRPPETRVRLRPDGRRALLEARKE